jgi:DNA-binding Lrp family transcriptional regulator
VPDDSPREKKKRHLFLINLKIWYKIERCLSICGTIRMNKIDFDIITILQIDADMPLSQLSRRVGISKTALWNRLQRLKERGVIKGKITALDRQALDLAVVVFLSITVGQHSPGWIEEFQRVVADYPEIVEVHRLTGAGADYQLKILCPSIEAYDVFQQSIIGRIQFTSMSTRIALSEIKCTNQLPLAHLVDALSSE